MIRFPDGCEVTSDDPIDLVVSLSDLISYPQQDYLYGYGYDNDEDDDNECERSYVNEEGKGREEWEDAENE